MKKDPNSGEFSSDQSLPRSKILRGRRNFERLFEKSTVHYSSSLQLRYRYYPNPEEGCFIGFIAPKKKIRGAVRRNKTKRLMREVYRKNQHFLQDLFSEKSFGVHAAFIANKDKLTYKEIKAEMIPLLEQARKRLIGMKNRNRKADNAINPRT